MEKDVTSTINYSKSIIKYIKGIFVNVFSVACSMLLTFGVFYFILVGLLLIDGDNVKTDEKTFVGSVIIAFCAIIFVCCTFYAFKHNNIKRFIFIYAIPAILTTILSFAWDYGII